jgi:AcrR family transcriptional regulator
VDLVTDRVKRAYRSEVREAAAAETRQRIRRAAAELFVSRGYTRTTLAEVAERAGVGERTLYDQFGNKIVLFRHTIAFLAVGDETRVPISDRPEVVAARDAEDPRQALALHVRFNAELMERAGDLITMGWSLAEIEPELHQTVMRGGRAAYDMHLALTKRFEDRGELRPGLDAATAADIAYGLDAPMLWKVLRRERRWSRKRYHDWVLQCMEQQLLAPDPHRGSHS